MWREVTGQTLSILATLLTFLSYQVNKKNQVLAVQTAASVCMCLGYFFLDATSGFALNVVVVIRNLTYYLLGATKHAKRNSLISSIGFALVMCVLGAFSWQGWYSLILIVALAANTVFLSLGDPQLLRKSILFTSSGVFAYNNEENLDALLDAFRWQESMSVCSLLRQLTE